MPLTPPEQYGLKQAQLIEHNENALTYEFMMSLQMDNKSHQVMPSYYLKQKDMCLQKKLWDNSLVD